MLVSGARPCAQRPVHTLQHPFEPVAAQQMHAGPDHWPRQPPCPLEYCGMAVMHDDCGSAGWCLTVAAAARWLLLLGSNSFQMRCSDIQLPGNGTHPANAGRTCCSHWQKRAAPADAWPNRYMARQSCMSRTAKAAGSQHVQLHWLHRCSCTMPRAAQRRLHGSRLSARDAGPSVRRC